jgi:eukaryotic-like serine/threonine-protein kinase
VKFIETIKSRSFLINLGLFAGAVLLLIFLLSFFLRIYTHHGEELTVPDFRNRNIDEVKRICDEKDLRYEIKDSVFEPDKPKLTVLDQNPKPNAKVKRNRRIYLILNAGKAPKVAMPNLKDVQRRQADRILQSNGLIPGTHPEYVHDPALNTVQEVKCNGKLIPPGTLIEKGSIIEYVLADGGQGGTSIVPDLTIGNKNLETAQFVLNESHLLLGRIDSTGVKNTKTAIIYKQNPLPGKTISQGDIVNVSLKDK